MAWAHSATMHFAGLGCQAMHGHAFRCAPHKAGMHESRRAGSGTTDALHTSHAMQGAQLARRITGRTAGTSCRSHSWHVRSGCRGSSRPRGWCRSACCLQQEDSSRVGAVCGVWAGRQGLCQRACVKGLVPRGAGGTSSKGLRNERADGGGVQRPAHPPPSHRHHPAPPPIPPPGPSLPVAQAHRTVTGGTLT